MMQRFFRIAIVLVCSMNCCSICRAAEKWLVDSGMLGDEKLQMVWEHKIPIQATENLETLIIIDDHIYGISDKNFMTAFDREKGTVVFNKTLAANNVPFWGLERFEDILFTISGNRLIEMSLQSGKQLTELKLDYGITAAAARNKVCYYIAACEGRMRVLRASDKVKLFDVSAENPSDITSIAASEESVAFSTKAGDVISIRPSAAYKLWQFKADSEIIAPMVQDGNDLVFAAKDAGLYCISAATGQLKWKYRLGAVPKKAPVVTVNKVYQYVPGVGLAAINKKTGKLIWNISDGLAMLAESANRTYIKTSNGNLTVIDDQKGKKLYSLNFKSAKLYASNTTDSYIYIADQKGRIACLKPVE